MEKINKLTSCLHHTDQRYKDKKLYITRKKNKQAKINRKINRK